MEKLNLEYWPVEKLRPCEKALRRNDDCVERMTEAIRHYGFRVPILAGRDGEVVDGHLRLKAARRLGLAEVPVLPAEGMSDEQIRAFRLLVNRSATWAEWNEGAVAVELAALRDLDVDLAVTGFGSGEIDRLLRALLQREEADPDAAPDAPDVPVSREADLWLLGPHRLVCGDATAWPPYQQLMGDERAEMVWTDPPYNVAYEGKAGGIKNDDMPDDNFIYFLTLAFGQMAGCLSPGGAVYVAHADGGSCGLTFRKAFLGAGFKLASCLVWHKNQAVLSRADYHWQHEPILYGWLPGAAHRWRGDRRQTTVMDAFPTAVPLPDGNGWQVSAGDRLLRITGKDALVEELASSVIHAPKPQVSAQHPTMKPVALIEGMLVNSSSRGDIVLDPFGGSGSTLIACERLGRVCRILELDPKFCDVIILRWQEMSGAEAVLQADGKPFSKVMAERGGGLDA
ncbi:MAG: DNA modification methylase [Desulfovibrionaceae bacterium]|nr:DNA modification methylase [Desulfovibrionaceae bacterium]